ncbi:MAG: hypothetical protein WHT47_03710 [Hydrogenothermaceae bacterium]
MRTCKFYCGVIRYQGTTPLELTYALDTARKDKELSVIPKKLYNNEYSLSEKECAICDIILNYRKRSKTL